MKTRKRALLVALLSLSTTVPALADFDNLGSVEVGPARGGFGGMRGPGPGMNGPGCENIRPGRPGGAAAIARRAQRCRLPLGRCALRQWRAPQHLHRHLAR